MWRTWQGFGYPIGEGSIPGGITKTGASRRFTLPPAACKWLQELRQVCPTTKRGWVFPGQAGQPLSVRGAQTAITKLPDRVGIEGVSSHSFRRSALTAAHQAGLSLREVAEISGHKSLGALERYLDQDASREGGGCQGAAGGVSAENSEEFLPSPFKAVWIGSSCALK